MIKNKLSVALFLFVLIISSGCRNTIDQGWKKISVDQKRISTFLNNHRKDLSNFDSLLIIPGVGCLSCITDAQSFYEKRKDASNILFVFTDIQDPKMFRQEIPDSLWHRANIIVDIENQWVEAGFQSIYPGLFRIHNKQLFYKIF